MNGKIVISAKLKVLTGMHIGGSDAFSAIGAIDSPVVKDARTVMPIIPGSSLKGKIRTLLARRSAKVPNDVPEVKNDSSAIKHLFGASSPEIVHSRLQFADSFLCEESKKVPIGEMTEAKFENTIDRITSKANPRQIERVISGSVFDVKIVYDIEDAAEILDDMALLASGMKLLQADYLGGHGTRGYGRVSLYDFEFSLVGADDDSALTDIAEIFKDVEEYELLHI